MDTVEHPRVSKREFISRIAVRSELPVRVVSEVYEAIFAELTNAVSCGETVVLTGFGRFYRQDHKGHKVRFGKNDVDDYSVLKFSASRSINRRLEPEEMLDPTLPENYGMIENLDDDLDQRRELEAV